MFGYLNDECGYLNGICGYLNGVCGYLNGICGTVKNRNGRHQHDIKKQYFDFVGVDFVAIPPFNPNENIFLDQVKRFAPN
jgi:hypothetical protein